MFKAVCNLEKTGNMVKRAWLNRESVAGYTTGDRFEYVFESESTLWLKDKNGLEICVPAGEKQCFQTV